MLYTLGLQRRFISKTLGSYHWNAERALSLVTVPLLTSAYIAGPVPLVDFSLGFVIPIHCYLGFETIIQDYLPARRVGLLHALSLWTLRLATVLAIYGCYEFNTNDVGLTEFVSRMWKAKAA
jgi:succinate dehydrogenase (ubiquinone) membrane anchor subunit